MVLLIMASVLFSAFSLYTQSVRLDESQSIWVATKSAGDIFYLMSQDVHPPLYNLLLHFWVQVFGTDIVFARTLSLAFFLLTLPFIFVLAKEAAGYSVAYLTTVLFALSPFALWYSSETRMYMLFTLATTWSNIYFLRVFRSRGGQGKVGYLLATTLGLYTHYFFLLVVFVQTVYIFFKCLAQKRFILLFLALLTPPFLIFLPWAIYFLSHGLAASSQPVLARPSAYNLFQTFSDFLFGFQNRTIEGVLVSLWPLLVIFLFFTFTRGGKIAGRDIDYFFLITFAPIILVFMASFIRPVYLSRYLIFVLPTLFFLIAWSLSGFSGRMARFLIVGLLVIMVGLLLYQDFTSSTPAEENYRGVANYLSQNATPGDIIAVSAPFTVYPLEYAYTGHARIDTIPNWDRYVQGPIPPFTLAGLTDQLNSYKTEYARLFLVLSYDQGYESRIRNYLDTHYQMLKEKKFANGIDLRVYRLRYDIPESF